MLWTLWCAGVLAAAGDVPVTIEARPAEVQLDAPQRSSCSTSISSSPGRLRGADGGGIELSVRDRSGRLELRREVNSDGERPSIAVVGERQLKPSEPVLIIDPFQRLEGALEAAELVFDFKLYGKESVTHTSITLHPRKEVPTAVRFPPVAPPGSSTPTTSTPTIAASTSSPHRAPAGVPLQRPPARGGPGPARPRRQDVGGRPGTQRELVLLGRPVLAVAPGAVVAAVDGRPDARRLDVALLRTDRMAMFGNHVVVRLQSGGVRPLRAPAPGKRARQGRRARPGGPALGAVGASGGAAIPHLHFELQTAANADGEGRPVRFKGFRRPWWTIYRGDRRASDTGQLVESVPVSG